MMKRGQTIRECADGQKTQRTQTRETVLGAEEWINSGQLKLGWFQDVPSMINYPFVPIWTHP